MKSRTRTGTLRKTVLPKLASFFRQLSLFDQPDQVVAPARSRSAGRKSTKPSVAFASLCVGPYAHMEVRVIPRMWDSWRVLWTRRDQNLRVEIPAILEAAPDTVKESVLRWALLVSRRGGKRDPVVKMERSRLETGIREYLRAPPGATTSSAQAQRMARNHRRLQRMSSQGQHHDLSISFHRINAKYFSGALEAVVTWSARLGGLSTHVLAQDGEGKTYHLITISRGYDNPEVTPEILDGVMYHECLHAAIPPENRNGRRIVHGREFRRRERAYEFYEAWRDWHRTGLPKALRRMRRSG